MLVSIVVVMIKPSLHLFFILFTNFYEIFLVGGFKNMEKDEFYSVYLTDNNITYSIDMLRLKTYITYDKFSEVEFLIKTSYKDKVKKFWCSDRVMCFRYNYLIELEEGKSIYFAFMHNTEKVKFDKTESLYNFTIEFNPNKLKKNLLLLHLLNISGNWYIKSYDMAFDINVNILDLITDMSGKNFERVENRGGDNRTIYLGKNDGRVKIYNKKRESNLNILGDLTRIEISGTMEDFEIRKVKILNYDNNFPIVYLNNYVYSLSDYEDKTLLAILYAVQNGFDIRNLTKTYRSKIKKLLEGGYKIKFSNKVATDLLHRIIFYYFMQNQKVVWW